MFIDVIQVFLIIATITLAILAIEVQDLFHSVIYLCGMCIAISFSFGIINAPYVMVFQLLIYAGASIVLFVSVIMLTKREEKE